MAKKIILNHLAYAHAMLACGHIELVIDMVVARIVCNRKTSLPVQVPSISIAIVTSESFSAFA